MVRIPQRGQVLIVVLVFAAILGAAMLSLYNVAQLSTAKSRLNNAADAAAYSGASVIAQGLNYTAYTNRAMLANNAMIGQMVSMRSTLSMSQWYWKNTETAWKAMAALTRFIPYVGGALAGFADNVGKFSGFWGGKVVFAMRRAAEYLTTTATAAIGLTNQVMWASQQVQLAESMATFEPVLIEIARKNAPDARLDPVMHATTFGPLTTLGMVAYGFQPRVRKGHRTLGTDEANDDLYLQYVSESNKHSTTLPYVAARNLLPNAVGLWIATGCDNPVLPGMMTGMFEQPAGLGRQLDTAVQVVNEFGALLSPVANMLMYMYKRQGGAEMVQLKDGRLAWTAVDAMGIDIPVVSWFVGTLPFAGGAVTSFVDNDQVGAKTPESVRYFVEQVKNGKLVQSDNKKKYMGHKDEKVPDCVEYLLPVPAGTWNHYAVSTTTKVDGNCAVLATGTDDSNTEKGLWGGQLGRTADKILNSSGKDAASAIDLNLFSGLGESLAALEAANAPNAGGEPYGAGNLLPAGITGNADSAAVTGLPNTAALQSAGGTLSTQMSSTGASLGTSLSGYTQALNPSGWTSAIAAGLTGTFTSSLTGGDTGAAGSDGRPGYWRRLFLKALGLEPIIDVMGMKMSDGVEAPRSAKTNKLLRLLGDGLPKWFWDVRVQKETVGRKPTQEYDLVVTDDDHQDYHPRRYGLGPLVYAPLIMDNTQLKTAQNLPAGGAMMGLPDYNAVTRPGLRAIGKARVFYRQPQDHWLSRYKVQVLPTLLLPYWQVRNEGLSYADKWGLMLIDGVASAAHGAAGP